MKVIFISTLSFWMSIQLMASTKDFVFSLEAQNLEYSTDHSFEVLDEKRIVASQENSSSPGDLGVFHLNRAECGNYSIQIELGLPATSQQTATSQNPLPLISLSILNQQTQEIVLEKILYSNDFSPNQESQITPVVSSSPSYESLHYNLTNFAILESAKYTCRLSWLGKADIALERIIVKKERKLSLMQLYDKEENQWSKSVTYALNFLSQGCQECLNWITLRYNAAMQKPRSSKAHEE